MTKTFSKKGLLLILALVVFAIACPLVVFAGDNTVHGASHEADDHWTCVRDADPSCKLAEADIVLHEHTKSCYVQDPQCKKHDCKDNNGADCVTDYICGFAEETDAHQHDENCYVPACTATEHTHGDGNCVDCELVEHVCEPICPLADADGHICDTTCALVCADGDFCPGEHQHSTACCTVEEHVCNVDCDGSVVLDCDAQTAGHTHDIDCTGCTINNSAPHTHTKDCYLDCEKIYDKGHAHTDACYGWSCYYFEVKSDLSEVAANETIELSSKFESSIAGLTPVYTWYLNGVVLEDENAATVSALQMDLVGANLITCQAVVDGQTLSDTITINVTGDTTGQPNPFTSGTDTRNINVQLFDYNTAINNYADGSNFGFFHYFGSNGIGNANYTADNNAGITGKNQGTTSGAVKTNLENGYPVSKTNNYSLDYLFTPSDSADGSREYYPVNSINAGLFQLEDGYYVYDSGKNAASYDAAAQRFLLYNATLQPKNTAANATAPYNFLPFNNFDGATSTTIGDNWQLPDAKGHANNVNLWFGMTVDFDFVQPKAGMIGEKPMTFSFTGDDDVWVYIDGMRVIDLGGTHEAQTGTIDFSTGIVTNRDKETSLYKCFVAAWTDAGKSATQIKALAAETFVNYGTTAAPDYKGGVLKDYSRHKLNFYYMERGGTISYCALKFNILTVPSNSVDVTKEVQLPSGVENDNSAVVINHLDFDFGFELWDENNSKINGPFEYEVLIAGTDTVIDSSRYTDINGHFSLKSGQTARFKDIRADYTYQVTEFDIDLSQYDTIQIDGTSVIINSGDPVQDIKSGVLSAATKNSIKFINYCTIENLLPLTISKTGENLDADTVFYFQVLFDNAKTAFAYIKNGDNTVVYTANDANLGVGVIGLKKGETATILNVLGDTKFSVQELDSAGYLTTCDILPANGDITYNSYDEDTKTASGIVVFGQENSITFNNEPDSNLQVTKKVNGSASIANANATKLFAFKVTINGEVFNFTLKDGETWTSSPFPAGSNYSVEEVVIPLGYSFGGLAANSAPAVGVLANEMDATHVTVVNNIETRDLAVSKTVTNYEDMVNPDQTFDFQVIFNGTAQVLTYRLSGVEYGENDTLPTTDATGKFSLKHGETALFTHIQTGTAYDARELTASLPSGFVYAGGNSSGILSATTLVNVRNAWLANGLNVTKIVDGETNYTGSFSFRLLLNGEPANRQAYSIAGSSNFFATDASGIFTLRDGQTASFANLPVGTEYSVEEINIPANFELQGNKIRIGSIEDTSSRYSETFVNKVVTAPLSVTKHVYNTETDSSMDNSDTTAFTFRLLVNGEPYVGPLTIGNTNTSTNSLGQFFLSAGQTAVINGLPIGSSYNVAELNNMPNHYAYESSTGTVGTITALGNAASFTNSYTPETDTDIIIRYRDRETIIENNNTEIIYINEENPPLAEIPDTDTPLASSPFVTIDDGAVPLAETPNTGDDRALGLLLFFAALSILSLFLMRKMLKAEKNQG